MGTKPSIAAYSELQTAYNFFNDKLFDSQLPDLIITFQRANRTLGYFSPERFDGVSRVSELAMNPDYFAGYPLVDILSTLVHEMVHVWQHYISEVKARRGYHDRVFAEKMEEVGLMASTTGLPGGKKTGQNMSHYIIRGGKFQSIVYDLIKAGFTISWYDRFCTSPQVSCLSQDILNDWINITDPNDTELINKLMKTMGNEDIKTITEGESPKPTPKGISKPTRIKFTCCSCGLNAWAKMTAKLGCIECKTVLISE